MEGFLFLAFLMQKNYTGFYKKKRESIPQAVDDSLFSYCRIDEIKKQHAPCMGVIVEIPYSCDIARVIYRFDAEKEK